MCKGHKYLIFVIDHTPYQFKVLAFGVKSAPRVFTKCLAAVSTPAQTGYTLLSVSGRLVGEGKVKGRVPEERTDSDANTA